MVLEMEKKSYRAGEIIHDNGEPLTNIMLILEGGVDIVYEGGKVSLKKGGVVGTSALHSNYHLTTAIASYASTLAIYPYSDDGLIEILKQNPETKTYFVASVYRLTSELFSQYLKKKDECVKLYSFITKQYKQYEKMCEKHRISPRTLPNQEEILPLALDEDVDPWLGDYYSGLYELITKAPDSSGISLEVYCGLIMTMSGSVSQLIRLNNSLTEYRNNLMNFIINEDRMDFFDLFSGAYLRIWPLAEKEKPTSAIVDATIELLKTYSVTEESFCRSRLAEYFDKVENIDKYKPGEDEKNKAVSTISLNDSLSVILDYSRCEDDIANNFRKQVKAYKDTVNKSSTDDADRKLRLMLAKSFYIIYNAVVMRALDDNPPPEVKMFLHFGYVDEGLAGAENASYLCNIVEHLPTDPEKNIYTFYQWLEAIYHGKKEPSRNEFDSDYNDYVHDLSRNNKINKAQAEAMLRDTRGKVTFELENVFPIINKVTNGRITTFCPAFSEHNVLNSLSKMLVSADVVERHINDIRAKDFGAFCRETVYSNPDVGIVKEMINIEILPDVILTPNIGSRGIMWQEIEGKRRITPSRFMMSLFQTADPQKIIYRLVGEFRWEMCRRIQGARWNDASERSLTSDYSDYLATYRRNNDLSPDVKEKVKLDLVKCKNNSKEMFIYDYINWLMYESNGSPRLNKVVRTIMLTYCPLSKEIREKLRANPLYTEYIEKYDIRLKARVRHFDNLYKSISQKGGATPPPEIEETRRLLML